MSVINILRKDWISYRKTMVWALVYLLLFVFCFRSMSGIQGSYIMTITLAVYIVSVGSIQNDEKNRVDCLLGILPLKRPDVVIAKFLLSNAFWLAGLAIYTVLGGVNQLFFPQLVLFEIPVLGSAAGSFLSVSFLNMLGIPLSYKFGSNRGRMITSLLGIMIFGGVLAGVFATGMVFESGIQAGQVNVSLQSLPVGLLMLGVGLVFQLIGLAAALRVYRRKEL